MASVLVEIIDNHGRVRERQRVALAEGGQFTIGRGAAADVVLDDPYVAALHANITIGADGSLRASDLGTVNGISIGEAKLHGAADHPLADGALGLGRTRLRIRTGNEALAPERRDNGEERGRDRQSLRYALAGGLVFVLFSVYAAWVNAPQDVTSAIAYSLISWTVGAFAWVAAWAFLSRVILGEWRWLRHAGTLFGILGALILLDVAIDMGWFAFSLPYMPLFESLMFAVTAGLLLYWHLTHASHVNARAALVASIVLPVVVAGIFHGLNARSQARNVNYIAMDSRLYPPAFRLREAGSVADYFAETAALKAEADRRRRQMPNVDGEVDEDFDDF